MKKIISYLLILVIAAQMFSIVAFAATSSYTAPLSFQGQHTGSAREYTGTDMHWYGSTTEQYGKPEYPDVFYVYLYRKNSLGSTLIGDGRMLPRTGPHSLWWDNVGSGTYYFFYSKARDGANVNSDRITMEMTP